jgi:hypothetical protein
MSDMTDEEQGNPDAVAWNAAYDILTAAGMSLDKAASLALYAGLDGRDPVAWARKYVRLRESLR